MGAASSLLGTFDPVFQDSRLTPIMKGYNIVTTISSHTTQHNKKYYNKLCKNTTPLSLPPQLLDMCGSENYLNEPITYWHLSLPRELYLKSHKKSNQ